MMDWTPDGLGVELDVHLVFDALDDGDEKSEVSLPDKDLLEDRGVEVRNDILPFTVVVGKENDGHVESRLPHHLGEPDHVHVFDVECRDDQVEGAVRCELERLFACCDVSDFGG